MASCCDISNHSWLASSSLPSEQRRGVTMLMCIGVHIQIDCRHHGRTIIKLALPSKFLTWLPRGNRWQIRTNVPCYNCRHGWHACSQLGYAPCARRHAGRRMFVRRTTLGQPHARARTQARAGGGASPAHQARAAPPPTASLPRRRLARARRPQRSAVSKWAQ